MKHQNFIKKDNLNILNRNSIPFFAIVLLMVTLVAKGLDASAPAGVKLIVATIYSIIISFIAVHIKNKTKGNAKFFWFILIALILNTIFIYPVLRQEGWPLNHEYLGWESRIVCYIYHFYQYDFLPFWSSGDAGGLGSPLPLFYHKTFNYIASFNYILLGNMKYSVILAIVLLNLLGAYGLYRSLRLFDVERITAFCISQTLLFLHYTITEWFIRAAFAEYAALMVAPWLLWWGIKFLKTGKFSYSIIPILFVLYHSHNIIAYYGIFAIALAVVLNLIIVRKKKNTLNILIRSALSAGVFFVLQLLYFYPMYILKSYYDPGKLKMDINDFFQKFTRYIIDTGYHWGKTWEGCTVEIGIPFWILVFISVFFFFKKQIQNRKIILNENSPGQIWLVVLFVFYVFLQLRCSLFFYHNVPGADFIQFPWRLNVFIQTIGLLIISFNIKWNREHIAIGLLGFFVCTYPLLRRTNHDWYWFPKYAVEAKVNEGIWGMREYIPDVYPVENENQDYFRALREKGVETQDGCQLTEIETTNPEQIRIVYNVKSATESSVILPYCYSGMEDIFMQKGTAKTKIKVSRIKEDPRMRIILPQGEYTLKVYLPQAKNIFR